MMSEASIFQLAQWEANLRPLLWSQGHQIALTDEHLLIEDQIVMLRAIADDQVERLQQTLGRTQVSLHSQRAQIETVSVRRGEHVDHEALLELLLWHLHLHFVRATLAVGAVQLDRVASVEDLATIEHWLGHRRAILQLEHGGLVLSVELLEDVEVRALDDSTLLLQFSLRDARTRRERGRILVAALLVGLSLRDLHLNIILEDDGGLLNFDVGEVRLNFVAITFFARLLLSEREVVELQITEFLC